jgi:hypothetical protein
VASDDVDVLSAAVGVMGAADLEQGLALGRVAGEMRIAAAIVARLQMPVLANFLAQRSVALTRMGVQTVVRATGARALSTAIAATGKDLAELSAEEVAEGIVRLAAAEAGAEMSEAMIAAGAARMAVGADELAVAETAAGLAREAAAVGVGEAALGAAAVGAAAAEADRTAEGERGGRP